MKAAKLPKPKEFEIHCMVAETLELAASPGWIWMHYPAGEYRMKATGVRLKKMGTKPGVSDFLLFAPFGARLHALELKRHREKPNDEQFAFLESVLMAGGLSDWADSYDAAILILKNWGALKLART